MPARRRLPIFRSVIAALLSLTGAAWLARGLIGFAGPSYYAPVAVLDFAAVWVMSVALLLSAGSFAGLLRDWRSRDRPVSLAAVTGIGGAAAAGIGNALEDVLGIDAGWMLYVVGAIGTLVALVALGVLALRRSATGRVTAGAFFAAGLGFLAADSGGLVITGVAFFILAWENARRSRW